MLNRLKGVFASLQRHDVRYAFIETGMGTALLTTTTDLLAHEITIFQDRVRIDVQTSTPGLIFADAWNGRVTMTYEGQPFYVVNRAHLIQAKRASGRDIDLQDAALLQIDDGQT